MPKSRVIVCGATGFIGRNAAEHLAKRDDLEVIAVCHDRPRFEHPGLCWVEGDLTSPRDVERLVADADVIVQAAATTSGARDIVSRPQFHVTDNAVMNSLLFRAAFEHKVRHVIFFSCTVMLQSGPDQLTEDDFDANADIHPNYFGVGWTKVYLEKMCEFYSRSGSTKFTAIRHSNVYGPHDKFDLERSHVMGASVTKVLSATGGTVTVWGAGSEARDVLYVADLVELVERVIDRQQSPFELYNAGLGRAVTINELVQSIIDASGRGLSIEHDLTRPSIQTSLCLDTAKAKSQLGWAPKVSLADGIRRTIDWWRENPPAAPSA